MVRRRKYGEEHIRANELQDRFSLFLWSVDRRRRKYKGTLISSTMSGTLLISHLETIVVFEERFSFLIFRSARKPKKVSVQGPDHCRTPPNVYHTTPELPIPYLATPAKKPSTSRASEPQGRGPAKPPKSLFGLLSK